LQRCTKCFPTSGAGFYLDATVEKWKNYRMYSYITKELIAALKTDSKRLDLSRMSILGHSMGGHGALTIGLKNPHLFKSVSAFSPICHPSECPWGLKGVSCSYDCAFGALDCCQWRSETSLQEYQHAFTHLHFCPSATSECPWVPKGVCCVCDFCCP
jgi:S-formylglutathione hydrolase FrmB